MDKKRLTRASADVGVRTRTRSPARVGAQRKASPSPARGKSPARGRSPARGKSPARKKSPPKKSPPKSPGRKKSPAREVVKSKAVSKVTTTKTRITVIEDKKSDKVDRRKKSAKVAELQERAEALLSSGPTPRMMLSRLPLFRSETTVVDAAITDDDDKKKTTSKKTSPKKSPKKAERSIDDSGDKEVAELLTRRRLRDNPSRNSNITPALTDRSRQSDSRSISRSVLEESQEFSDEEDEQSFLTAKENNTKALYNNRRRQQQELEEFGGQFGCLSLLILLPVFVYFLNYFCTRRECVFRVPTKFNVQLSDFTWSAVQDFMSLEVVRDYLVFVCGVCFVHALPLGRIVKIHNDRGYIEYYFNGLATGLCAIVAVASLQYYNYDVLNVLYRNYQQLICVSVFYAIVTAGWCYVRANLYVPQLQWNPYAKTQKLLIDYYLGREINPKWFSLIDIKLVHYRASLVLGLLYSGAFFYKNLKFATLITPTTAVEVKLYEKLLYAVENVQFDWTIFTVSGLVLIYIFDLLVFEHHLTSSFELQHEGEYYLFCYFFLTYLWDRVEHPPFW
jgi:Delta14-sterol reductase (lamin-B receptor)